MDVINKYFALSEKQKDQFEKLGPLYADWNSKINVISRKDIDNLYVNHVLHSLAIAKYIKFADNTKVLDLGTGGGFPGIPLAIMYPEVSFLLVDSVNKKLKVVEEIANAIGLTNITVSHTRVEDIRLQKFDFVVTRAVAATEKLRRWTQNLFEQKHINTIPNGIIALKGTNIKDELKELSKGEYYEMTPIDKYFSEPYFEEKSLLYLQA